MEETKLELSEDQQKRRKARAILARRSKEERPRRCILLIPSNQYTQTNGSDGATVSK